MRQIKNTCVLQKAKNGGYSLVEIMVAMVGLSLVAFLLASILITSVRSDSAAREADYAVIAAKATMNELTAPKAVVDTSKRDIWQVAQNFMAPNNKVYNRRFRLGQGRPIPVSVKAWLQNSNSDTNTVLLQGFINVEDICDTLPPKNPPANRPLIIDNSSADPRPSAERIEINVTLNFLAAEGNQVSTGGISRLFTVVAPDDPAGVVDRLVTRSVSYNDGVNNPDLLTLNSGNQYFINTSTLPFVKDRDSVVAVFNFTDCAGRPQNPTATQTTRVVVKFVDGISYTVSFDTKGGSEVFSQTVPEGATANRPSDPTKAGNTFVDWYSEATLTNIFNFSTPIKSNRTLHAKWEESKYVVYYNSNHGTAVPSTPNISYGSTITKPTNDPTKGNHKFVGWFQEASLTNAWLFGAGGNTVVSDTTLHAKWLPRYTVQFNTDGGSAVASINNVDSATAIVPNYLAAAPVTTKAGNAFAGWWTQPLGGTQWNFTNNIVESNITLNARWTQNSTVVVTFNFNYTGSPANQTENVISGLPVGRPTDPTRTGHVFVGWFTTAQTGGEQWNFANAVSGAMTLFARWATNTYTVSFNSNGGSAVSAISPVAHGATITKPADPEKHGNIFTGWYKEAALTNEWIFGTDVVTATITLFAKWTTKPLPTHNVSFNAGEGSLPGGTANPRIVTHGNTVGALPAATRDGYNLAGWFTVSGGMGEQITASYVVRSDLPLFAHWTAIPTACWYDHIAGAANSTVGRIRIDANGNMQVQNMNGTWVNVSPAINTKTTACNLSCTDYTAWSAGNPAVGTLRRDNDILWVKFNNDWQDIRPSTTIAAGAADRGYVRIANCGSGGGNISVGNCENNPNYKGNFVLPGANGYAVGDIVKHTDGKFYVCVTAVPAYIGDAPCNAPGGNCYGNPSANKWRETTCQ